MSRSFVNRADPCVVAANPPTAMYSTPASASNNASYSVTGTYPACPPQLIHEHVHRDQRTYPFLRRTVQFAWIERAVDVLLVGLDDRVLRKVHAQRMTPARMDTRFR